MTSSSPRNAIVLFAHGSRDPLWHKPMEAVAERIRAQSPEVEVTCAYLELSQPDLPDTAAKLVANGVNHITIVPMFLGVGRHAREDLPELVVQLKAQHPSVTFHLQAAVGEDARLLDMLAKIALSPA
ncbi:sirohydrochlorin chelatase [Rhodoferax mekongensis]|uniref:CbiX/SirB N-terminal domain-containing protein n=1 Tax=Rhodoferax mekongensis TaxID=3068341 RepID=A0ABZ0AVC3_9BURK|nr:MULTISPECIES: CbiX/SirB N-terminal domain-containing protein [unclassified Rhodoferax]MDT7515581.1 CbiX/SirB N-terminal domain-containing protein [Rhodoferax sp. TBRC 17199]WNO03606.1 CbiX/SirB N-terminal domain-containing protein [Rhodoferax sp. TBRC 17307]